MLRWAPGDAAFWAAGVVDSEAIRKPSPLVQITSTRLQARPSTFKGLDEGCFLLGEEMPVSIEDDADARVPGTGGDLLRVCSSRNPQRNGGMSQVVNTQRVQRAHPAFVVVGP